jgi:diguanylate cyclase (GGDEF)-like protein
VHNNVSRIFHQICSSLLVDLSPQEFGWLLSPRDHNPPMVIRRATVIVTRARLVAGLFAILTPLWIIVDAAIFPPELWHGLAVARILAALTFLPFTCSSRRCESTADAYRALAPILIVPTLFFVFSYLYVMQFDLTGIQVAFSTTYTFLPFVMIAGLAIFPLTLGESIIFSAPMLFASLATAMLRWQVLDWPAFVGTFWLLLLIAAVSAIAGLSQLAFMIVLVRDAIHDSMTGCLSRQTGEDLLEMQFLLSCRIRSAMALAFIDLDHFKEVNDLFGHEVGDRVLVSAAESIHGQLRAGDILMRWGGEEFLLVMPNISAQQAMQALTRLSKKGFGIRPDGSPITASIGIAERQMDRAEDWKRLVELADSRMYLAKKSGRNRIIASSDEGKVRQEFRAAVQSA